MSDNKKRPPHFEELDEESLDGVAGGIAWLLPFMGAMSGPSAMLFAQNPALALQKGMGMYDNAYNAYDFVTNRADYQGMSSMLTGQFPQSSNAQYTSPIADGNFHTVDGPKIPEEAFNPLPGETSAPGTSSVDEQGFIDAFNGGEAPGGFGGFGSGEGFDGGFGGLNDGGGFGFEE